MAFDLAMTSGSSGAPLFRLDAPANTFCGVNIGGMFYHLLMCIFSLHYEIQYYQDERWPQGWNHAYTVANPYFVNVSSLCGAFLASVTSWNTSSCSSIR
jgi:hypothetical protein